MESGVKINGCKIGTYSRLASKCRACMNKEYCRNKRFESEAYLIPQQQISIDVSEMKNYGITVDEAAEAINKLETLWNAVNKGEITPNEARAAAGLRRI